MLCSMQGLSSLTTGQIHAPCIGISVLTTEGARKVQAFIFFKKYFYHYKILNDQYKTIEECRKIKKKGYQSEDNCY